MTTTNICSNITHKDAKPMQGNNEDKIIYALSFKLTDYCNLKCPHCWLSCSPDSPKRILPLDAIRFYIDDYVQNMQKLDEAEKYLAMTEITLTGGEIFETLEWAPGYLMQIVEHINKYNLPINFETNNMFIYDKNKTEQVRQILHHTRGGVLIKSSMDEFHNDRRAGRDSVDAMCRVACMLADDPALAEKVAWYVFIQKMTRKKTYPKLKAACKEYGITNDLEHGYPPYTEFKYSHAKDRFCFNIVYDPETRCQGRAAKNHMGNPTEITNQPKILCKANNVQLSSLWFNEQCIASFNNFNPAQRTSIYLPDGRFKTINEIISDLYALGR